jgi:hypothetical protein
MPSQPAKPAETTIRLASDVSPVRLLLRLIPQAWLVRSVEQTNRLK